MYLVIIISFITKYMVDHKLTSREEVRNRDFLLLEFLRLPILWKSQDVSRASTRYQPWS